MCLTMGKLVLDFLQAIHAAGKKVLKEKYEKKLKDAAVRELMLAEEAAMLNTELERERERERAKAALALKSLQEKMEEKLKIELDQKVYI
ncbi:hypothetical protein RJT34_18052 [Clitoria ternatea]|uniref:Uncharacterized protein n=1 Tax=Clitoria ternatea TaxID=43366 RepID=A0AAN9JAJ7_CLITE